MSKQRHSPEINPQGPTPRTLVQNPALPTERAANGKPEGIQPCASCIWAVPTNELLRCHFNPPQVRMPYDNMAAWPVVPSKGGGCSQHKDK
jgi:hypothetical protein